MSCRAKSNCSRRSSPVRTCFTFRAEGNKPPLFLMPSMAGTVLQWREFVRLLPSDRPVCGIYMAGEPDYTHETTFEELAAQCAQGHRGRLPRRTVSLVRLFLRRHVGVRSRSAVESPGLRSRHRGDSGFGSAPLVGNNFKEILRNSPLILKNSLSRVWQGPDRSTMAERIESGSWENPPARPQDHLQPRRHRLSGRYRVRIHVRQD